MKIGTLTPWFLLVSSILQKTRRRLKEDKNRSISVLLIGYQGTRERSEGKYLSNVEKASGTTVLTYTNNKRLTKKLISPFFSNGFH